MSRIKRIAESHMCDVSFVMKVPYCWIILVRKVLYACVLVKERTFLLQVGWWEDSVRLMLATSSP